MSADAKPSVRSRNPNDSMALEIVGVSNRASAAHSSGDRSAVVMSRPIRGWAGIGGSLKSDDPLPDRVLDGDAVASSGDPAPPLRVARDQDAGHTLDRRDG